MNVIRKVIIVSGGSRGLGAALVDNFLDAGHVVATFSRSPSDFIESCRFRDPEANSFYWESVDGVTLEQLTRFAKEVMQRYGRIDVLVNNAAVAVEGILTLMQDSDIHRAVAVNLEAVILLTRACLKAMVRQRIGCVINVSSVNALRGSPGVCVYSATKAALNGFTRSLAREMGPAGIRVNSVAPGYFESEMTAAFSDEQRARIVRRTPLRRMARVEDVVGVVNFLLSPSADFITGQVLVVDGGISC